MSVVYAKFSFASAPRTGTTWFLCAMGLAGEEPKSGGKNTVHIPTRYQHLINIAHVRDPCDWLLSYYTAIWPGKIGVPEVDALVSDKEVRFDEFIKWYLKECPGQVGKIFNAYPADNLFKLEDQPWALMEFLESLGYKRQARIPVKNLNAQNPSKIKSEWDKKLRQKVRNAEHELCSRFDY